MSEFDAQRVAERIDIVLDILRQVAESTPDIPKAPWEI